MNTRALLSMRHEKRDPGEIREVLSGLLSTSQFTKATKLLYEAYQSDVRHFVAAHVWPADHVDDVCGEIWLAVASALKRYRGEARPLTWIMEIAHHKVADLIRRTMAHPVVPLEQIVSSMATASSVQPGRSLQRAQLSSIVRRVLDRLRPDEQELLELRYVRGLTPSQIIKEKNLPDRANTVSKRLSLLRQRVRRLLEEESVLASSRGAA